jgi:hypothetical protein
MPHYWYTFYCADCCLDGKHIKINTSALRFLNEDGRICPQCESHRFQPLFGTFSGQAANPPEAYRDSLPVLKMTRMNVWKCGGAGISVGGDFRVDISGATIADCGVGLDVTGNAKVTGTGVRIFGRTLNDT